MVLRGSAWFSAVVRGLWRSSSRRRPCTSPFPECRSGAFLSVRLFGRRGHPDRGSNQQAGASVAVVRIRRWSVAVRPALCGVRLVRNPRGRPPVPSVGRDALGDLAGYPVLAFGMLLLLVRYRFSGWDACSQRAGCSHRHHRCRHHRMGVRREPIRRQARAGSGDAVLIAYPMFDLLLLAVVVRLLLSGGRRSVAYGLVAASVLVLLITDGFYTVATTMTRIATATSLKWVGCSRTHCLVRRRCIPQCMLSLRGSRRRDGLRCERCWQCSRRLHSRRWRC